MKKINLSSNEIYVLRKILEIEIASAKTSIKELKTSVGGSASEDLKKYLETLEAIQEKMISEN